MDLDIPDCILVNTKLIRANGLKFIQPSINMDAYKYNIFPSVANYSITNKYYMHADTENNLKL